jgi:FdhE protein
VIRNAGGLEARLRRARSLAQAHPASSGPLAFFAKLTELQCAVIDAHPRVIRREPGLPERLGGVPPGLPERLGGVPRTFAESLDFEAAADAMPSLLSGLRPIAPQPTVEAATAMLMAGHAEWRHLVHTYWRGGRDDDPLRSFLAEALLQPFAESVAASVSSDGSAQEGQLPASCGACGDRPVVAVLREAAHGARRSLVCGFCLKEWPVPRIGCASCGEREFEKLAIYAAEELPAARVDACETCRRYIKTIDLTKDGTAVPVVDDLATLTLDLWARDQGYQRLRPNLLRF